MHGVTPLGMLVYFEAIWVTIEGQGHSSKLTVTEREMLL